MQYAPANSIQKMDHLLPYPNIPVVVIEEEADVNAWAAEHYKDSRQWVSQKLKEATAEDRAVKRAKRKVSEAMSRPSKVSEKPTEEPRRKTKVGGRKGKRKTKTEKPPAEDSEKEHSVSLDSLSISIPEGLDGNPTDKNKKEDFFKRKALEVYPVDELILPDAEEDIPDARTSVVSRKEIVPAGLERLWMKVKRHTEKQRLPNTIFKHRASVGEGAGVADLGIAMAFVIMRNAIDSLRQDGSAEMRSARAHYRWRFLRTLVRTGEAAFILYRVSQEQAKVKALTVGSVPGLVMAPELSMMGTKRTQKVATRQVPYVLQDDGQHKARQAEITNSGMVVYHNISRKK
ncbi:hypothetical protein AGDE_14911 [Angomonas deanei]|nr:hypothetical protein AGDE_14911 [Angomonas deanei]|eukprot:EPY20006.1 hypothetical protein AGDE_14911 [Angomonas deanei]